MAVGLSDAQSAVPVLWWRSAGHTHTAYAMETLMDMAAEAAGEDPVEFRLELLSGEDRDRQLLAGVLKLAARKAGWDQPAADDGGGRQLRLAWRAVSCDGRCGETYPAPPRYAADFNCRLSSTT